MAETTEEAHMPIPRRGMVLLATTLSFGIAAFLVVALRVGFRASRRTISISDYCITLAVLTSFTHTIFDAMCVVDYGYGYHEKQLPLSIKHDGIPLKLFWLGQILFKLSTMFTKLSLFFVYRDLFDRMQSLTSKISRIANYVTVVIVFGYYTAATLVSIFACTPVSKSWIPKQKGSCINSKAFLYSTATCNILTSLLLIGIPIPVLMQTKHRKREVTQLICLVLLGLADTASSIVRLAFIATSGAQAHNDTTWTLIPSTTAATIEMNVAIIAASLVVMRPCFAYIYSLVRPKSSSVYYTNPSRIPTDAPSKRLPQNIELLNRWSISQERILPIVVGQDGKGENDGPGDWPLRSTCEPQSR